MDDTPLVTHADLAHCYVSSQFTFLKDRRQYVGGPPRSVPEPAAIGAGRTRVDLSRISPRTCLL